MNYAVAHLQAALTTARREESNIKDMVTAAQDTLHAKQHQLELKQRAIADLEEALGELTGRPQ